MSALEKKFDCKYAGLGYSLLYNEHDIFNVFKLHLQGTLSKHHSQDQHNLELRIEIVDYMILKTSDSTHISMMLVAIQVS